MSQQMVDLMEAVWQSIDGLCAGLTQEQWSLPTECPGWSVQDQVSHLVGSECRLLGRPAPAHEPADTSHVRNEVGQGNEVLVDYRRQFSGAEVLAEFREITAERLGRAARHDRSRLRRRYPQPPGQRPLHRPPRHPHLRRLGSRAGHAAHPGHPRPPERPRGAACLRPHRDGHALRGGPQGQARRRHTVVFEITGEVGGSHRAEHGRRPRPPHGHCPGVAHGQAHHGPGAFNALGTGRWSAEHALSNGSVAIEGDRALGERIVGEMNFMI